MSKYLVFIKENKAVTDSLIVAEMFGKRHDAVLRDIRTQMEYSGHDFSLHNFVETQYQHEQNKQFYPKFDLTEDAFMLVCMSYNTKEAVQMKIKFIQEFKRIKEQLQKTYRVPTSFAEALRLAADQQEEIERLKLEDCKNKQIIGELQPKATYYDLVLQNKQLLSVTKIAKDYGMSARKLNEKLHSLGIQFKQGDCWFLYQKHASKGFTQTKTHVIDDEKGKTNMYWTQKGRLFIYETLKQEGILPLIEREKGA